jgi:hypothetical protein
MELAIYRKHAHTGIIPHDLCHPHEQKASSINCVLNRLRAYPITEEAKEKELYVSRAKRKHLYTTPKDKMGFLHIRWKRNKEVYKTL